MRIELFDQMFNEKERPLCQFDAFSITTFRYNSGVAALRIINARGEIIVLPFQGQQIWRANFDGRELTMRDQCLMNLFPHVIIWKTMAPS